MRRFALTLVALVVAALLMGPLDPIPSSPLPGGGVSDGDKGDITVSGGGTSWTIDADAVDEATLKSTNGPTDEYCLTYESSGGGDFEWQTCGGGGGGLDHQQVMARANFAF